MKISRIDHLTLCVAALKEAEIQNIRLKQQITKAAPRDGADNGEDIADVIEKPSGSSWSIQQAMGLQGRGKKYDSYKAIQVCR